MPILTVHLEKITNLADEDHIGKSDPYVKVCLVLCWFVSWAAAVAKTMELLGCNCTYCPLPIIDRLFCNLVGQPCKLAARPVKFQGPVVSFAFAGIVPTLG